MTRAAWPSGVRLGGALVGLLSLALLASCESSGQLVLRLDLPVSGADLNPLEDTRLHHFTLTVRGPDGLIDTINTVTWDPDRRELPIGDVPVGPTGRITLVGYGSTSQVLAYGEGAPVVVDESGTVSVDVALRKPFTYVAGGHQILGFDTSRSHADDIVPPITLTEGVTTTAIASTPDGRFLLATVADLSASPSTQPQLTVYTTAHHSAGQSVTLSFSPGFMSVSPDRRWAVLSEIEPADEASPDQADKVALVDLPSLLAGDGESAVRVINLAQASRAAFVRDARGEELVVILRNRMQVTDLCGDGGLPSQLSAIRLEDGSLVNTHVLNTVARDVASRPEGQRAYVALPCEDQVAVYEPESDIVQPFVSEIPSPTALILVADRLWIGSLDEKVPGGGAAAQLVVTLVDHLDGSEDLTRERVFIDFPSESVLLETENPTPGREVTVTVKPFRVQIYRLSVPPGENRLSALVMAEYHSDPLTITDGSGTITIGSRDILSASYIGLDTATAEIRRRLRALCLAFADGDLDTDIGCKTLAPHEEAESPFLPLGATTIYGAP